MAQFTHGGELVGRALAAQGVTTLYTLCGGHIAPIFEGCLNNDIRIIDFRHEQAAAHAADAHARLTRNIGVAAVTAGPGVTDAVTGVANAYYARSPLVLLGGAAPLKTKGMGALQEMPQVEMFGAFTKASFTVEDTALIPRMMARAFEAALKGRPGPVFVELPFDVLFNAIDPPDPIQKVTVEPQPPPPGALARLAELLLKARQPLIIAGSQVYWDAADRALRALSEAHAIPVFSNGAGRGTLPMDHPHCFKAARGAALKEADLVLLIGTPLDFRLKYGQGWNPEARLVQIENDPAELNRNRQADLALEANARLVLEGLVEELPRRGQVEFGDWLSQLQEIEGEKLAGQEAWQRLDDVPVN
ncbi:MAG: thiamine pyrophosphate-binding protein, partial [Anaerolineae bacterium]